jgi:hypothetical protein
MASLPAQPETSVAEQVRAPSKGDFASYVEARRRSRGESATAPARSDPAPAPPLDDDIARSKRIVAANLGLDQTPTFGKPMQTGGIFQVTRLNYNDAEFLFFGWNKEIGRQQTIPLAHDVDRLAVGFVQTGMAIYDFTVPDEVPYADVVPELLGGLEFGSEAVTVATRALLEGISGEGSGLDDEGARKAFQEWYEAHRDGKMQQRR